MSKRYTPQQKAAALSALAATNNVAAASHLAGVPQRTLFRWQRCQRLEGELPQMPQEKTSVALPLPQHLIMDDPEFEAILRRDAERADTILDDVLKQLLESVRVLAGRVTTSFDHVPPTTQMMALARLIDRILKLEARQPRIEQPKVYILRYQYPDGSIHMVPPWAGDDDDDDDYSGDDDWLQHDDVPAAVAPSD